MTSLLDANVLIAMTSPDHVHHDRVTRWFAELDGSFATCPITQGSLLRAILRQGGSAADAMRVLDGVTTHPRHQFWPDDATYDLSMLAGVIGHRQVTDAYLASSAARRGGRLVTLDVGLAALHPQAAELITAHDVE